MTASRRWLPELMALGFVVIWSTGFIVARSIAGRADPNLFLSARFALATLVFVIIAAARRERLPSRPMLARLLVVGALLQGLYLGPGFWAVGHGMQPGVMALIGALQPPLTAAIAWRLFGERMDAKTLVGIVLGIAGVALAVSPLLFAPTEGLPAAGAFAPGATVVFASLVSIAAITAGTLLQRGAVREVPLATASAVQGLGGLFVVVALAPVQVAGFMLALAGVVLARRATNRNRT